MRFANTELGTDGTFTTELDGYKTSASLPLFLVREAWERGLDLEDLADGFGKGLGTCGGDWSGVRDSSPEALNAMFERALNFLLPATSLR